MINQLFKINKKIRFKTLTLRSNLCDYSDAYIVMKGKISVTGDNNANKRERLHIIC